MKILWITSFRGFKKKSRDTSIQIKFLKEISRNKNIDFCVTQFGEANVKEQLQKNVKKFYFYDYGKNKNYKYCQNKILFNGLNTAKKGKYDLFIWSTADIILTKNYFSKFNICVQYFFQIRWNISYNFIIFITGLVIIITKE